MRKNILLMLAFLLSAISQTLATPVTITVNTPGTGESQFEANSTAKEIVLKGTIDQRDLLTLKQHCRVLETLDMRDAVIAAYSDEESYTDYKEGEFTGALAYSSALKNVVLPSTVKSIAPKALAKCNALESITIPGTSIPTTDGKIFIESKLMTTVKLYVPENLVDNYKKSKLKSWTFTNILPIASQEEKPFAGLELDDFYGPNFFPYTVGQEDAPIFYAFYLNNGSTETVNTIEFEYWFDNDRKTVKTFSCNDIQLAPGQNMNQQTEVIGLDAPVDTRSHIVTIKPIKVNGVEVDLGFRVKPYRRYYVEGTYRRPTHLVEVFFDPTDPASYEKYRTLVTSMATMEGKTKQENRYEIVSFVSKAGENLFVGGDAKQNDLAQAYRIDSIPRVMVNRNLFTPYGTLNNHQELEDLGHYTPAMKIGDLLDVHTYLFQRGFNVPGFAQMTPEVARNTDGSFAFKVKGRISSQETHENLLLNLYLVENVPMPKMNEDEQVLMNDGDVFRRLVKMVSPLEGFALEINADSTYCFTCDTIKIDDFAEGKYRLVASIYNFDEQAPYRSSVLQSCGVAVSDAKPGLLSMTTIQESGSMSFALAAATDNTPVSIDWGDGNFVDYTIGKDFSELRSELKGKNLVIKGDVTKLNCISNKLTSLDITACPMLQVLQAEYNYLYDLDLSKSPELLNVEIFGNSLKSIDLSACTKLIRFVGSGNYFDKIELANCPNLEYFDCARMGLITSLDLSHAHKLKNLIATDCSISDLKIAQDAPLIELLCAGNKLSSFDFSPFNMLVDLDCSKNLLSEVNVKSNSLKSLMAMNNKLTSIDLKNVPNLEYLMLTGNAGLASLDVALNTHITDLGVSSCNLSQLNLSAQSNLARLWCTSNKLQSLDLSKCEKLAQIKAGSNLLTSIVFPMKTDSLTTISLPSNRFVTIDLKGLSNTLSLDLGKNQLHEIDLSEMTALKLLNLRANGIHAFDLSHNKNLSEIGLVGNDMTACELNAIYKQLPKLAEMPKAANLHNGTKNDAGAKTSNTDIAVQLNWKPDVQGDGSGCTDGIEDVTQAITMTVWKEDDLLILHSPYAEAQISIYTADGKLVKRHTLLTNEWSATLPQPGVYIVKCTDMNSGASQSMRIVY